MECWKICVLVAGCVVLGVAQEDCYTPDGDFSSCLELDLCRSINEVVETSLRPLPRNVLDILKRYRCGSSTSYQKVCCPSHAPDIEPPNVSNHPNLRLLPRNCGNLYTGDGIIKGNETRLLEYPWMALLSYKTGLKREFECGGTIINDKYILTAAHCLKKSLESIRVGEYDIRTPRDCELSREGDRICTSPHQNVSLEEVIYHRQFNYSDFTNDIALIRVSPMDLSRENIKPICLPLERARNYNLTNKYLALTGWWITGNGHQNPVMLQVKVRAISNYKCSKIFSHVAAITYRQVCAGGDNKTDTCSRNGVSGSPLQAVSYLHDDHRMVQQGILSFGSPECVIPDAYTRVAHYMDWILDNMKP